MKIESCYDENSFYEALTEINEFDKKNCILIDKKYKDVVLGQGNLPRVEILKIVQLFSQVDYTSKDNYEFHKGVSKYFLIEYDKLQDNQPEKYTYSTIVFISDIFYQPFKEALKSYIQRTITTDTREANLQNEWVRSFEYFIKNVDLSIEFFIDIIKELIEPKNFFSLQKAKQRAIFYWWLHVVWTHKPFMNHQKWLEFKEPLKILSDESFCRGDISTQMYIHFFAYQVLGNLFQTQNEWAWFNKSFNKPQSKAFKSLHVKPLREFNHKKKRIVFVKDRIVENAPYKVEYSLFSSLLKDKEFTDSYDLYVLSLWYVDKAPDQEKEIKKLENLGITVVAPAGLEFHKIDEYYNHLKKAELIKEWFLQNEIDIMVGCVNGYDIMNYLFTCRVAKKQIYWSHGDFEYDVEGIDKKITHIPKGYMQKNDFIYERFRVNSGNLEYKNLDYIDNEVSKIRDKFGKNKTILGSIGRLIKIDSFEYLSVVAKILKMYPNSIYLACGTGNKESIKQKLKELDILDKFYFEGWVDASLYAFVIDIYLNTFPEPSGESLAEFLSVRTKLRVVDWQGKDSISFEDTKKFIENYTKEALICMDMLYQNRTTIYDIESKYFWSREQKKYELIMKKQKLTIENKKDFLSFCIYLSLEDVNDEEILFLLNHFALSSKFKIYIFTHKKFLNSNLLLDKKIEILDIIQKDDYIDNIDFIINIPKIYAKQLFIFGIRPVIWLNKEEVESSMTQKDFIDNLFKEKDEIVKQEKICFAKMSEYNENSVYRFLTKSYKKFGVQETIIDKLLNMGELPKYQYKIEMLKIMEKNEIFKNAYKTRVYLEVFYKCSKIFKKRKNSAKIDYKVFE